MSLNEKTAGVAFPPDQTGKIDFNSGFASGDPYTFTQWCH